MYPPNLYYLKEKGSAWFNPSYGIMGFFQESKKISEKLNIPYTETWKHRSMQRAKEIYATAIVAKAMSKQEQQQWWIYKPNADPPDGVIGTIIHRGDTPVMHVREVEVVEHIDGDLADTIRTKLSQKYYEPNTILACYVTKGGVFDLDNLATTFSKEATNLEHIFLVFPGQKLSDIDASLPKEELLKSMLKISSVQIKPVLSYITIDPLTDCKPWMEGEEGTFFIYEGLGKGEARPITLENPPKLF